jgi:ADP-ribosyl-[dinitrogen reductase] hydrolase
VASAASLGGDADTVAAVAGAMAGAYYGYPAIPDRWKNCLLHEQQIHNVALQLANVSSLPAEA